MSHEYEEVMVTTLRSQEQRELIDEELNSGSPASIDTSYCDYFKRASFSIPFVLQLELDEDTSYWFSEWEKH